MKSYLYKLSLPFFLAAIFVSGCKKEYETIAEIDTKEIDAYVSANSLTGFESFNNIRYKVVKPGAGQAIDYKEKTPILVTVKSLNGSFVAADTFAVYNRYSDYFGYFRLKGFADKEEIRELIKTKLVKKGGEIRMLVPSSLAYGRDGYSYFEGYSKISVGSNSSLDVTVKVIDDLAKYENAAILKYIADNKFEGFKRTTSGLYYKKISDGAGDSIRVDSTIKVSYTGKLLNGKAFETVTDDNATSFVLRDLAKGWQEGIPYIKEGGSIRLIMPSHLAYGISGSTNPYTGLTDIPPFSTLDFEIKVIDVSK